MKHQIANNLAIIFVIAIVVFGVGWSVYDAAFSTTAEKADKAIANLVEACERAKARSEIFQAFAREAAAARRSQAAEAAQKGDKVTAQNNIATAQRYESFARQWNSLTIQNCQVKYGVS